MTYAQRISRERQAELESLVRDRLNGMPGPARHAEFALLMDGLNAERAALTAKDEQVQILKQAIESDAHDLRRLREERDDQDERVRELRERLGCAIEELERRHPLNAAPITARVIRDGRAAFHNPPEPGSQPSDTRANQYEMILALQALVEKHEEARARHEVEIRLIIGGLVPDEWQDWPTEAGLRYLVALVEKQREALEEIAKREARSDYTSIYAAPGEFAAIARCALSSEAGPDA